MDLHGQRYTYVRTYVCMLMNNSRQIARQERSIPGAHNDRQVGKRVLQYGQQETRPCYCHAYCRGSIEFGVHLNYYYSTQTEYFS